MTVKFGAHLPQGWQQELAHLADPIEQYELMTARALEAERAGFDSIWLWDHFHTVPRPALETTFECWTAMAALARDTSRIRLGQMVTCNGYRQPSLLAKMASCVDVMSHGRVIVGIGAGWYEHEYLAYGYSFPETPDRLRMLRESLQVLKAMWTQDRASFEGRFYRVKGAINQPKPIQKPHPPLWIGGGGERVTLKLVALYGDACNVEGPPDLVRHKLDVLRRHCEAAGRDCAGIVKSTSINLFVGDRAAQVAHRRRIAEQSHRTEEEVRRLIFYGTATEVAARIRRYVEAGIEYVIIPPYAWIEEGALERFAQEVIPLVAG